MPSIFFSNARAPVVQLVGASDQNLEDPGLNFNVFFSPSFNSANKIKIKKHLSTYRVFRKQSPSAGSQTPENIGVEEAGEKTWCMQLT